MKHAVYLLLFLISINYQAQSLIEVPFDAATLSAAVQQSQPGDTILLHPGIYSDSVHLYNTKLHIKGHSSGGVFLSPGTHQTAFVLKKSSVTFDNLIFDDFLQNTPPPNIGIAADSSEVVIRNCQFHNMFTAVSCFWSTLELSRSVVTGLRGFGGIFQNGGQFDIYNNLFYRLDRSLFALNRCHGSLFHNTIIGSTPTKNRALVINADSISHIFNNIIQGFGIGIQLLASDSTELQSLRIHHNNVYASLAPYWYEYNKSLNEPIYRGALIAQPGHGELRVWSDFKDTSANDFGLKAGSPCTDAGTAVYPFPVPYDQLGNPRTHGVAPDLGALEYQGFLSVPEGRRADRTRIFPNPNGGAFTLAFSQVYSGEIEVIDVSGSLVKLIVVDSQTEVACDLSLAPGIYHLRWFDRNVLCLQKMVVQ